MKKIKCQCSAEANVPFEDKKMYSLAEKSGMNHKPGKCKGTNNIKKYRRGNKELYLCSCCYFLGDIEIK